MELTDLYQLYQLHPVICTDSRKVEKDALFFALRGANFDGNQYAADALDKGARFAIIDNKSLARDERYIVVDDVLETLQKLARHHRQQFDIPVLAITGSNGKTTTKELISAVLESHYPVHFTRGNFNNHIGVPLTLLDMPIPTEVAVIEMGANHVGEIAALCNIALPTHGIITNIGRAHLEGFGGLEGVKKGKGELYRFLERHHGTAFINKNEPHLEEIAGDKLYKIFFEKSDQPDADNLVYEIRLLSKKPFIKAAFLGEDNKEVVVQSQLAGDYNFSNIMAAISIGWYFKVPSYKIVQAIESYLPSNNRSQLLMVKGNRFLLDAYNANPTSMINALESFATDETHRKIAILGDMLELGDYSQTAHQEILNKADQLGIELITVGKEFGKCQPPNSIHFHNVSEARSWFWKQDFKQASFLLKGSRGIKLEKIVEEYL